MIKSLLRQRLGKQEEYLRKKILGNISVIKNKVKNEKKKTWKQCLKFMVHHQATNICFSGTPDGVEKEDALESLLSEILAQISIVWRKKWTSKSNTCDQKLVTTEYIVVELLTIKHFFKNHAMCKGQMPGYIQRIPSYINSWFLIKNPNYRLE